MNNKGNTRVVIKAIPLKLYDFPFTKSREITKHFMNLHFFIEENALCLLSFLIFRCWADNTIKYETKLLAQYAAAAKLAHEKYDKKQLSASEPVTRKLFKSLIEKGLLLPTKKDKIFLINPCLTYSKRFIDHKFYKEWVKIYEILKRDDIIHHAQAFIARSFLYTS